MANEQNADVLLLETRDFQGHLRQLKRIDDTGRMAHRRVVQALQEWAAGKPSALEPTRKAVTEIPHGFAYDLPGDYRLVTYEHAHTRIVLMVGTSTAAAIWLELNANRDFTVNNISDRIRFTPSRTDDATTAAVTRPVFVSSPSQGPVFTRIPINLFTSLNLPEETAAWLCQDLTFERLNGVGDSLREWTDDIAQLTFPSTAHRNVVLQVAGLLARGQDDEAVERLSLFLGQAATASSVPGKFIAAVTNGQGGDFLVSLTGLANEDLQRLVGQEDMAEWMLFLHSEQKRIVERDFNGPSRLIGVSGSGKTSVLIHRANDLAKKYPGERILVLTLNAALAQLLNHLADRLCGRSTRMQVVVRTIYEYCYEAAKTIAPDRKIEKLDPLSGENLTACWNDFMEKPHAQLIADPIVNALHALPGRINAAGYLLDELTWIRGGFGMNERPAYAQCDRPGRGIEVPRQQTGGAAKRSANGLPTDTRSRTLQLLQAYEEYMRAGGLMDEDGVSLEAYTVKDQIPQFKALRARCVLVDEVQDCSTVELAVISQIPTQAANGLFLVGDPVQKVFAKQHDMARAGINIIGRSSVLKTNYRNTRQILQAAYEILLKYRDMSPVPPSEVLEPEYAFRDGPRPRLYECVDTEEQVALILRHLQSLSRIELDTICICSPSEHSLNQLEIQLNGRGIPHYRIRANSLREEAIGQGLKVASIQDIKGFEFGRVFLIDLIDTYLLPSGMPYEERWRIAFQIYVAMTRAREVLVMSFVFNRSILLAPLKDTVEDCFATDFLA